MHYILKTAASRIETSFHELDNVLSNTRYEGRLHSTVHFRYSGHLELPLSGHYIRLATIIDLNIKE